MSELDEVDPKSADRFLAACAENADSKTTAERRASTIRSWARRFRELREQYGSLFDQIQRQDTWPLPLGVRNVLGKGDSIRVLHQLGSGTRTLRVASGFFTQSGYLLLAEPLNNTRVYQLVGQDERNPFARRSVRDVGEMLVLFRESLRRGIPDLKRRKQTRTFHEHLLKAIVRIRHFEPRATTDFHAKVYIFDNAAVYVTSANLTVKGLQHNIEGGRALTSDTHREDVARFVACFDNLFGMAAPITHDILDAIEKSWAFKQPVTPYQLFLKVMHELHDRLPAVDVKNNKPLADFQRHIVTPVISKLESYRGVMLISPTGSGKTLMASFIAAYLRQERNIQRVVIIAPNDSIAAKWRDEMNVFDIPIECVNHGILRREDDELAVEHRQRLEHLREQRAGRLFVVDECHHFRNRATRGWKRLSCLLGSSTDDERPYCLLLTATPISVGFENVNALLELIAEEPINTASDIEDRHRIVNVTLAFILKHFGIEKAGSPGRALQFGPSLRYYPDRILRTERYSFGMTEVLHGIERLPMDFAAGAPQALRATQGEDDDADTTPTTSAGYGAMLRKNLARRAESSPAALRASLDALDTSVGEGIVRPTDRTAFVAALAELRACLDALTTDSKLEHLLDLLRRGSAGQKTIVFSEAVATVEHLTDVIKTAFPGRCVKALTGTTTLPERQSVLRGFPLSIDILVSSNACSEGEDLPGAHLVVNYDLSWTPLTLAQRIGRIDRATPDLKIVTVLNFYPGGDDFDRLVGLWDRLDGRAQDLRRITGTRVLALGEHRRGSTATDPEDTGVVRDLYESGEYEAFLKAIIPMPQYLEAWLGASQEERDRAAKTPDGVQSGEHATTNSCYVLLRHRDQSIALVRDQTTNTVTRAPRDVGHETLVRTHAFAARTAKLLPPPDAFDDEVADIVRQWASEIEADPEDVTVVASKYLRHQGP